jgi:mono/diheme cytochrome c family protein
LTQPLIVLVLVFGLVLVVAAWAGTSAVHALPEYTTRTGETCATCHVSAGGGGPRTLRGLLWGARGRPDRVPTLPGLLIAPGVTEGAELYDIACAGCHGRKGEGLFGTNLTGTRVGRASIRSFIVRGILPLGMPAFKGQFTADQLDTLVVYVAQLASGEVLPPADTVRLPPAQFKCKTATDFGCQGPRPASGEGN